MTFKETETIELKKSLANLDSSLKTVCAFLNHKGGKIYFGIDNGGNVIGQPATDKNLSKVSQKIRAKIKPEIVPEIEEVEIDKKPVIKVAVENYDDSLHYCNGIAYTRCGTETVKIPPDEMEKRIIEKHKIDWERQICRQADFRDLNQGTIKDFIGLAKKSNRLNIQNEDIKLLLKKLELIRDNKLTNAALLLFGKEPFNFFPNITVKCGRFKDEKKKEFIDMKDYNGNLFDNLENSMLFLKNHLKISAKISGLLREEKWEIPLDALRESMLNALIHRDYCQNSFVYIKFYDEKIVIANPGKLPRELSISDLYREHESRLRNPIIANVFYMAGFIDAWGRGILDILELMDKENLDRPDFEESGNSFRIIFNRHITPQAEPDVGKNVGKNVGREERKKVILDRIKKNIRFTYVSLAEELNVSEKTIERDIKKLKEEGKIRFVGSKRNGIWKMENELRSKKY